MKVVFCYPATENLGIEYLSAALKGAGHTTELVFDPKPFNDLNLNMPLLARLFSMEDMAVEKIVNAGGGLIAFSVVTDNFQWAVRIAEKVKRRVNTPIVFGGIHPTAVPEQVLEHPCVDYVIRGEGEGALVELAATLENGAATAAIQNLSFRNGKKTVNNPLRPLIHDLDALPFPDKEFFYNAAPAAFRRVYHMQTSRGCAYHCSFCFNSFQKAIYDDAGEQGKYLRRRSIPNVIRELKEAREKWGYTSVEFWDDIFTLHKGWTLEFLEAYATEVGAPFACRVNPNAVDEALIAALEKANCRVVHMGIQSFNEATGEYILKRKQRTVKVEKIIDLFAASAIYLLTDNLIGIPNQKEEEMVDLLRFYNRHRVDYIKLLWLRYYPKIEIVNVARGLGVLSDADVAAINNGQDARPFTETTKYDNPVFGRIRNLGILLPVLPRRLASILIEKRLYRFFPKGDFYSYGTVLCRAKALLTGGKKPVPTYFSVGGYLRMSAGNITAKLGWLLGGGA